MSKSPAHDNRSVADKLLAAGHRGGEAGRGGRGGRGATAARASDASPVDHGRGRRLKVYGGCGWAGVIPPKRQPDGKAGNLPAETRMERPATP